MKSEAENFYDSRKESIRQLSKGKFLFGEDCPGYLVTVTSKNTGRTLVRYCKDDDESEKFIDYASCLVDDNGQVFYSRILARVIMSCDFSEEE